MGAIDISGMKFGKARVLYRASNDKYGNAMWSCMCDCGTRFITLGHHLRSGKTKSCGCLQKESAKALKYKHGYSYTRIYGIWSGMIERCGNPNHTSYKNYGGKGVFVCDEWKDAESFIAWALSNGYKDGLSIDRRETDKGYSPENCRFVTRIDQNRNTSRNRFVSFNSSFLTTAQVSEMVGISRATAAKWHRECGLRDFSEYEKRAAMLHSA